jgi:hypothetical protein
MSVLADLFAATKRIVTLTDEVTKTTKNLGDLAKEVREIDKRLVRVETMIEIAKHRGGTRQEPPAIEDQGG